jgi:Ca2+-binding RTX toxin-like protein
MKKISVLAAMLAMVLVAAAPAFAGLFNGDSGVNDLTGTDSSDIMYGRGGDDVIAGLNNRDKMYGNGGNDIMSGDDGKDVLRGGSGDDRISGGNGQDEIFAGSGDDFVVAGDDKSADEVNCGLGNDTAILSGPDHQAGSQGNKTCEHVRSHL